VGIDLDEARRLGLLTNTASCVCDLVKNPPCDFCRKNLPRAPCAACGEPTRYALVKGMGEVRHPACAETPPKGKPRRQPEFEEQRDLVETLRAAGISHAASLNGVKLTKAQAGRARAGGMTAGEPDLRIDGHPMRPCEADLASAAARLRMSHSAVDQKVAAWLEAGAPSDVFVELKAAHIAKRARHEDPEAGASDAQRERMATLREESGATCIVAYGAEDARAKLREMGWDL